MPSPGSVCPAAAHCKAALPFVWTVRAYEQRRGERWGRETRAVVCGEGWGWSHVYPFYCLSARKEECRRPQMSAGLTVPRCCDLSDWAKRIVGRVEGESANPSAVLRIWRAHTRIARPISTVTITGISRTPIVCKLRKVEASWPWHWHYVAVFATPEIAGEKGRALWGFCLFTQTGLRWKHKGKRECM